MLITGRQCKSAMFSRRTLTKFKAQNSTTQVTQTETEFTYLAHVTLSCKYHGLQSIICVADFFTGTHFSQSRQQLRVGKLCVAQNSAARLNRFWAQIKHTTHCQWNKVDDGSCAPVIHQSLKAMIKSPTLFINLQCVLQQKTVKFKILLTSKLLHIATYTSIH